MKQHRVISERMLFLRATGDKRGTIIAGLTPGTLVAVTGAPNKAGYAMIWYGGWIGTDGETLYPDSLAPNASRTDGKLYLSDEAERSDPDVYGRIPVTIAGWVSAQWLEAIE